MSCYICKFFVHFRVTFCSSAVSGFSNKSIYSPLVIISDMLWPFWFIVSIFFGENSLKLVVSAFNQSQSYSQLLTRSWSKTSDCWQKLGKLDIMFIVNFCDPFCFAIFTCLSFTFLSTSCPLGVQWSTEGYFLLGPNRAGQGGAGSAIFAPHPLPSSSLSPSSGRGRRQSLHVLYRPARCRVDSYGRNRKRWGYRKSVLYNIVLYFPPVLAIK